MNRENYATLEASKRLVEAGIVLETDMLWATYRDDIWLLGHPEKLCLSMCKSIPAPCMAEVWRELPTYCFVQKFTGVTIAGINGVDPNKFDTKNVNPTDALIDLLIWTRKERT